MSAALERAYSDNEVRIRALLQDMRPSAHNLVDRPSRSAVPFPLADRFAARPFALISDAIASRVDDVANSITGALEDAAPTSRRP